MGEPRGKFHIKGERCSSEILKGTPIKRYQDPFLWVGLESFSPLREVLRGTNSYIAAPDITHYLLAYFLAQYSGA